MSTCTLMCLHMCTITLADIYKDPSLSREKEGAEESTTPMKY